MSGEKIRKVIREMRQVNPGKEVRCDKKLPIYFLRLRLMLQITKLELVNLKKEVMDEVVVKLVPDDVISKVRSKTCLRFPLDADTYIIDQFMLRSMDGPQELWRMRKQFAQQLAALNFTTYVFCLSSRVPSRFHISRSTGQMYMTELLPSKLTVFYSCSVVHNCS
jgi:transformation/transcription domain-associated protein